MTKRTTEPGIPRNDLPGEGWHSIPGYEGLYEISNLGRVFRLGRVGTDGRTVRSRMLKVSVNNGFRVAYLPIAGTRKARALYVEKVIAQLFPIMIERPDSLPGEDWRDIQGYEGLYKISSLGRILSLGRIINDGKGRNRFVRARIRMPGSDSGGYPKVDLAKEGKNEAALVHRLVAMAFVPNPLGLPVVHHKDEIRTNPRAENLEWVTSQTNISNWFDRRRVEMTQDTITAITAAAAAGKSPAEILASLPRRRKTKNKG